MKETTERGQEVPLALQDNLDRALDSIAEEQVRPRSRPLRPVPCGCTAWLSIRAVRWQADIEEMFATAELVSSDDFLSRVDTSVTKHGRLNASANKALDLLAMVRAPGFRALADSWHTPAAGCLRGGATLVGSCRRSSCCSRWMSFDETCRRRAAWLVPERAPGRVPPSPASLAPPPGAC